MDSAVAVGGPRLAPETPTTPKQVGRVWCVSDVHTDHADNLKWCESLTRERFGHDALIVAGDVSASDAVLRATLVALTRAFGHVFFTPGNHDLWMRGRGVSPTSEAHTSLHRLEEIFALCEELGVVTRPAYACGAIVAPILSWYHASWDEEPDIIGWEGIPPAESVMVDFHACRWPAHLRAAGGEALASHFDGLNDARRLGAAVAELRAAHPHAPLLTFSHFVPRCELNPEKRYLFFPGLAKACGSSWLRRRVEALAPDAHVFGHTHFGWDATHGGTRYVQAPLSYPAERRGRLGSVATGETFPHGEPPTPLMLYDGDSAAFPPTYDAGWSNFYRRYPRRPDLAHILAPYVASNYEPVPGVGEAGWFGDAGDPTTGRTLPEPLPAWKLGPKSAVQFEAAQRVASPDKYVAGEASPKLR